MPEELHIELRSTIPQQDHLPNPLVNTTYFMSGQPRRSTRSSSKALPNHAEVATLPLEPNETSQRILVPPQAPTRARSTMSLRQDVVREPKKTGQRNYNQSLGKGATADFCLY